MMGDRLERLYRQMFKDLEKLSGSWMADFQEETGNCIQDLLSDAFDPEKMMQFISRMGIDMSQFEQMFDQAAQTGTGLQGFDPYQVFGLDRSASDDDVKKRYGEMMRKIHPDVAGPEMNFLASIVNGAYEMIGKERGW